MRTELVITMQRWTAIKRTNAQIILRISEYIYSADILQILYLVYSIVYLQNRQKQQNMYKYLKPNTTQRRIRRKRTACCTCYAADKSFRDVLYVLIAYTQLYGS